eukprot:4466863-Pleurochrysis_carterae.AAC.1
MSGHLGRKGGVGVMARESAHHCSQGDEWSPLRYGTGTCSGIMQLLYQFPTAASLCHLPSNSLR